MASVVIRVKFLIIVLFSNASAFATLDQPSPVQCDPNAEKKWLDDRNACEKRLHRSEKHWISLEDGKVQVLKLLEAGKVEELSKYLSCDSEDESKIEIHCEADDRRLVKLADLKQLRSLLLKSEKKVFKDGAWKQYGLQKNLYLYCSPSFRFQPSQNYCDDGKVPVIELRKLGNEYHISGIPISGIKK